MQAERITDAVAYHGEGPAWSARWGGLRFVDMFAGDVLSLLPGGGVERRHVGDVAAVVRPRQGGGAVLALERGFALEDGDGMLTYLGDLWPTTRLRMNEGGCDPDGRFYCGSMAYDRAAGAGSLYRLDPDGSVSPVITGVTTSNGLDWSPDGALAYYVDTDTSRVDAFDYVDGELTGRRPFVTVEAEDGRPDGLVVDAEGGVWVALNKGGCVRRYTQSGVVDAVVELPVRRVTACTFGGEDLGRLFVTTSREGLRPDEEPAAGSLFAAEVGIRGVPSREFAG